MKIAIAGASGLVGGACMSYLRARGHDVIVLGRKSVGDGQFIPFELGQIPVSSDALRGVDALVHCAHDMGVRTGLKWNGSTSTEVSSCSRPHAPPEFRKSFSFRR